MLVPMKCKNHLDGYNFRESRVLSRDDDGGGVGGRRLLGDPHQGAHVSVGGGAALVGVSVTLTSKQTIHFSPSSVIRDRCSLTGFERVDTTWLLSYQ